MKILVLDNYDSFVYNLVALIRKTTDAPVDIIKNDLIDLDSLNQYSHILLSPGPGIPSEAGKMMALLEQVSFRTSVLGVCLGHQAIAAFSGASLCQLSQPLHGVATPVVHNQSDFLFDNIPARFQIGHYHSWVVTDADATNCLEILAQDSNQHIMALRHKAFPWRGVQFHPESILTEYGDALIYNWIKN